MFTFTPYELLKDVNTINSLTEKLKTAFELTISDRKYDLHERWELFIAAPQSLKDNNIYWGGPDCVPEVSLYDDFYMDRGVTKTAEEIVELFQERIKESDRDWATEENLVAVKEEFLAGNLGEVTYDW